MRIIFLGTGPYKPIIGKGKNNRENTSTLFIFDQLKIQIDAGKDIYKLYKKHSPHLMICTHSHEDATKDILKYDQTPFLIPIKVIKDLKKLPNIFIYFNDTMFINNISITPFQLNHGDSPTYGYHFIEKSNDNKSEIKISYASDFLSIPKSSKKYFKSIDLAIVDGSGWNRPIFAHQSILKFLEESKNWDIDYIIFTRVGRNVPDHKEAQKIISNINPNAILAFDSMEIKIG